MAENEKNGDAVDWLLFYKAEGLVGSMDYE
jgi:hypothetical protein